MGKIVTSLFLSIFFSFAIPCFGDDTNISLSPEEVAWLSHNHTVRVRIGHAPPFMFTDGTIRGIAIDYLTQIFNRHGIHFVYVMGSEVTWPQALKYIEQHDVVDMVPTAKVTDERKQHMLFTSEYITAPWVIFTRSDANFISSIEDLKGKLVSVEEGFVIYNMLKRDYPEIRLKVTSAAMEHYFTIPIKELSTGLVDAYVGNLMSTTYMIQAMGYTNVKVAAPTPFENHNQAMGIRNDWHELVGIINKTLASMTPDEHAAIRNRWLSVRYEYGISSVDIFKWLSGILLIAALVIGTVLISNRRLKAKMASRLETEKNLLASENRLRTTLDATPFPVSIVDIHNEKILHWSQSAETLFGHTARTASQWYQIAYPDPDYRQKVVNQWKNHLDTARLSDHPVNTGTYRITCKDGSERTCELWATFIPDYLVVTFNDITERKQAEEALRQSEERFRILFDEAPLPYQSLSESGILVEVNKRWLDLLGYQRDEVVGRSFADFLHPEWVEHFRDNFPRFKSIGEILGVEFQLRKKDGTYVWTKFDGKIRRDNSGVMIQTHCVFHDITEQMRLKEKIKAQAEAIRHAEKMESVGTLAGGIAHDFNNILSIILGNNEMISEQLAENSPIRENTEEIHTAGLRARDVVRQLLTFSRKDNATQKPLDLETVVRESYNLIRSTMPANIEMELLISGKLLPVRGNSTQINQILINLCTNAKDAVVESGGKITIDLHSEFLSPQTRDGHPQLSPGQYNKLSVTDDGCGIDVTTLERIFDPYFTTKDIGKGTGIGLSVVHGIVQRHGGCIFSESEPGKGTTISILLPTCESREENIDVQVAALPKGSERILLVDDEAPILKLGIRRLGNLGYKVIGSTDPIKALELFKESPDDFNMVITDMAMPKMTGKELSHQILQIRPNMPIILCTGYSENISEEEAAAYGIHSFVLKPIEYQELASIVRNTLDHVNGSSSTSG